MNTELKRMTHTPKLTIAVTLALLVLILFSACFCIFLGSADVLPRTVLEVIRYKVLGQEVLEPAPSAISIVWELRMPRVLLAIAAGGGLAVAGAAMQAITQNVMADPYILGASGGSSAAVAFSFVLGGIFSSSHLMLSIMDFGGAMLALLLVYAIGMVGSAGSSSRLILSGMAASSLTARRQLLSPNPCSPPYSVSAPKSSPWNMENLTSSITTAYREQKMTGPWPPTWPVAYTHLLPATLDVHDAIRRARSFLTPFHRSFVSFYQPIPIQHDQKCYKKTMGSMSHRLY